MNDYSHILDIKVVSNITSEPNKELEKIVVDSFLQHKITYHGIPIVWRRKIWKFPDTLFRCDSIIVIELAFGNDIYIINAVKEVLELIENDMRSNDLLEGYSILFSIVKIVERFVLVNSFNEIKLNQN